jgi:CubicO group peptidase (beta-lactamase class C family)
MKKIKKLLIAIVVFAVVYFVLPKHVQMGLVHNFADVDDYKLFDKHTIQKSSTPIAWQTSENYNKHKPSDDVKQFFDDRKTCAYLVIKDGKILYENYLQDYNKETISGSFSMAKTINALLIGKLIEQGKIASINDDVKKYVPELTQIPDGKLTIKDAIMMSAQLDWTESYWNIFSLTAESYYGENLDNLMGKLKLPGKDEQGKIWEYQSSNTQILGYIIKNVTKKSLAENANQYLWQPLGAESDALWSTDKNGVEKSFCCINATARDFAKLGQMVLQHGNFNNQQLFDSTWIARMTSPDTELKTADGRTVDWYGYQMWIINYKGHQIPYFRGILGQFIFVIPDENAIVVRLGKKIKRENVDVHEQNDDIKKYVEIGLQVLGK